MQDRACGLNLEHSHSEWYKNGGKVKFTAKCGDGSGFRARKAAAAWRLRTTSGSIPAWRTPSRLMILLCDEIERTHL